MMAVTAAVATTESRAQQGPVRGRVIDSRTGDPVRHAMVCADAWCMRGDQQGEFAIPASLRPADSLLIQCGILSRSRPRALGAVRVPQPFPDSGLRVLVDATGCDQRIERRTRGTFTGYWEVGFEHMQFTPCPQTAWYIVSDTAKVDADSRTAWLMLRDKEMTADATRRWPKPRIIKSEWNYPQYFIRWKGTIVGPGEHGHFGVSAFLAEVDSLLEIRTPAAGDCAAAR